MPVRELVLNQLELEPERLSIADPFKGNVFRCDLHPRRFLYLHIKGKLACIPSAIVIGGHRYHLFTTGKKSSQSRLFHIQPEHCV